MRSIVAALLILCCTIVMAAPATPDYAREKRWAEEITPQLMVGDAVYLTQKNGHRFLALYTTADNAPAAVIVVHGLGVNPNWGLIGTLRSQLADNGYTTLSVQMPVLAADAKGEQYPPLFPDAAERLDVAYHFLHGKGCRKIAIVSHSMGSRMTNYFLNHDPNDTMAAWVAIGMPGAYSDPQTLKMPILDLYGEHDLPVVLENAKKREAEIQKIRGSAQIQAAGADHFFNNRDKELIGYVKAFLDMKLK
ncbi:MAG TPA: DUF3530 family protein [Burkholderiales bacterium]|jgi:dienelactone hydrolase|nr:DUF3530 family protein [Burkholderiales bacterium]